MIDSFGIPCSGNPALEDDPPGDFHGLGGCHDDSVDVRGIDAHRHVAHLLVAFVLGIGETPVADDLPESRNVQA